MGVNVKWGESIPGKGGEMWGGNWLLQEHNGNASEQE